MPSDSRCHPSDDGADPTPPPVADHRLVERIGRGAYGDVWLAENAFGTRRAVKVVYRRRFEESGPYERELAGIRRYEPVSRGHEGLLDILQIGPSQPDDHFYYVMELADDAGPSGSGSPSSDEWSAARSATASTTTEPVACLRSGYRPRTLRREIQRRGQLPVAECARIGLALTEALAHLHAQGLVHRDIKPSNIVYVGGVPKLADIGLVTGDGEARTLVGTPGYIPPEGPGTAQGDLFGLGKVLYELSTGKPASAFPEPPDGLGRSADALLDDSFADLNLVLIKACDPLPKNRYGSAEEMSRDLWTVLAGRSVRRTRRLERHVARLRRGALAAGAVALLAGGTLAWQRRHTRQVEELNRQNREQLVRMNVATGIRSMDDGDLMGALPWFVEALRLTEGDAERERMHRFRIESVRRECPKPISMGAHDGPIHQSMLSPDQRRVLTASDDGTAVLWEADSGRRLATLIHGDSVQHALYASDGRWVATASADGTARLWDAFAGQPATEPLRHDALVAHLAFSPDGSRLASASWDGTVRVWHVPDGRPAFPPIRHADRVWCVTYSPNGEWLASGSEDRTARIWSARTGESISPALEHPEVVRWVVFAPDGRRLLTACNDGVARVWKVPAGGLDLAPLRHADQGMIWHATFDSEGRRIATAGGRFGASGEVGLWDATTGDRLIPQLRLALPARHVEFSPDGGHFVVGCLDGLARIMNATNGQPVAAFLRQQLAVWTARFSADGFRLLTSGRDGTWHLWDLTTDASGDPVSVAAGIIPNMVQSSDGRWLARYDVSGIARVHDSLDLRPSGPPVAASEFGLAISFDGSLLATAPVVGQAVIQDVATGTVLGVLTNGTRVFAMEFHPFARQLATADGDGWVRLWSTTNCVAPRLSLKHPKAVSVIAFDPTGTLLATGTGAPGIVFSDTGELRVWDVLSGDLIHGPFRSSGLVTSIAFSPDGHWFVATCADNSVTPHAAYLRSLRTGAVSGAPIKHGDGITKARFSSDSTRLVTAGEDGAARIWSVPDGNPVTPAMRHMRGLADARFTADGRRVLTASSDGTARLWDAGTGEPLTPPLRHTDRIRAIGMEPRHQWPITAGHDRSIRVWQTGPTQLPFEDLVRISETLSGMRLTATGMQALETDFWVDRWRNYSSRYSPR